MYIADTCVILGLWSAQRKFTMDRGRLETRRPMSAPTSRSRRSLDRLKEEISFGSWKGKDSLAFVLGSFCECGIKLHAVYTRGGATRPIFSSEQSADHFPAPSD